MAENENRGNHLKCLAILMAFFWVGNSGCLSSVVAIVSDATNTLNSESDYKPVGFNSKEEAQAFAEAYGLAAYMALYLSPIEWRSFYKKFPKIWNNQFLWGYSGLGSARLFHPWYTGYAWRWTTLERKKHWDPITSARLEQHKIKPGDNAFQLIYASGPPKRVLFDNDWEIFLL